MFHTRRGVGKHATALPDRGGGLALLGCSLVVVVVVVVVVVAAKQAERAQLLAGSSGSAGWATHGSAPSARMRTRTRAVRSLQQRGLVVVEASVASMCGTGCSVLPSLTRARAIGALQPRPAAGQHDPCGDAVSVRGGARDRGRLHRRCPHGGVACGVSSACPHVSPTTLSPSFSTKREAFTCCPPSHCRGAPHIAHGQRSRSPCGLSLHILAYADEGGDVGLAYGVGAV